MRRAGILGLAVAVLGVVIIGVSVASGLGSVRSFLDDRCESTGVERDGAGHRARGYRCAAPPSRLAADLADAHPPAERRSTPTGHFLRYGDEMVGVLGGGSGSRVLLADERDGYGYFLPFVGGWWGTYGGPGERFRGGGPGGGK